MAGKRLEAIRPRGTAKGEDILGAMLAIQRLTSLGMVKRYRMQIDNQTGAGFYLQADADELRKLLEERAAAIAGGESLQNPVAGDTDE